MTDRSAAVAAAAFAISTYDWHNGISANPEVSPHQRAEAEAALKAGAGLWALERIAERFFGVPLADVGSDEMLQVRFIDLAIALNEEIR